MKFSSTVVLLMLLALHLSYAADGEGPEPIITSSTVAPTGSTTPTPTSTSFPNTTTATTTTVKPTSPPNTTTTPSPTTSSTTTPKPTPSPTTPEPTSTTTTPKPTPSTTTPKPTPSTTTPKPTPSTTTNAPSTTTSVPPKPSTGTWQVNTTNSTCILLKMAAMLELNYTDTSNGTEEAQIAVPIGANVTGFCGKERQTMNLTWSVTDNITDRVEFIFGKDNKKFEMENISVIITLDSKNFPLAKDGNKTLKLVYQKADFITPENMSYKCLKLQTLALNTTDANITVHGVVKISDFQFQAFGNITNGHFADAKDCEPYETPDIVPIAVGCALMALIIIVLIGYLIGRRRNQARGYLSM